MKKILVCLAISLVLMSCTENARARSYGGTQTIVIDAGKKVVTASWKDGDLWILTEPMTPNDEPRTLEYIEKSNLGMMEGKIVFVEKR